MCLLRLDGAAVLGIVATRCQSSDSLFCTRIRLVTCGPISAVKSEK